MSKSHIFTFDIEVYDKKIEDEWPQGTYLVHGLDDVLWTDDIESALEFIKESCLRALEETKKV